MSQKSNVQPKFSFSVLGKQEPTAPPTRVSDVMTVNVVTLLPSHTLGEAVCLMANRPFRHFPVVHPDGRLAGVLSDRDLLRALGRAPVWQSKAIGEIMTRETISVSPETAISVAVGEMLARRINCLPVVDERGKVCGIVTSIDLLAAFQKIQASLERVSS